jgi:cobalt/nickel transport system permease protein
MIPKERWLLLAYVSAVVGATLVHHPGALGAGLLGVLLLAGRGAPAILARTLRTVLVFNLAVSVGYSVLSLLRDQAPWDTLLRINLRVLLITTLTFLFIARVNLFRAVGFSRTLTFLLGLGYSQAMSFKRAYGDFRLALVSRSPARPSLRDRHRASAAAAAWFMDKALTSARESAQALRTRGFFDD